MIGATSPELTPMSILQGPRAATNPLPEAQVVPTQTDAPASPPLAASTPVDIDAFMAAWGTDDATWDIDGSGTVDGSDLGQVLAAQTEALNGDAELQGLLGAWGTADPDWDLNGDGIVNGADLGIHLNGGVGGGTADSTEEPLDIEGFAQAWGSSDPAYDLNGDGIVDGADLGTFLQQQTDGPIDQSRMDAFMNAWGSDDPEFDFNGDGIVDGVDLGHLLETFGDESGEQAREMNVGDHLDQVANRLAQATFQSQAGNTAGGPLGQILAGFGGGTEGLASRSDVVDAIRERLQGFVDADGNLDQASLQTFIGKWMNRLGQGEFQLDPIQQANLRHGFGQVLSQAGPAADGEATRHAADRVGRTLSALGRESLPPNLSHILGKIALPGTNSDAVMMQLLSEHPIGGVETTA